MDKMPKITILQLNDLHGYLEAHPEFYWEGDHKVFRTAGGVAHISGLFKEIREENPGGVIALDNGDTIHGTYPVVTSNGEVLEPILNELRLDGWTVHWDFAYGSKYLKEFSQKLNYPLIAINCYQKDNDKLYFEPYRTIERHGLKIGVIGIAATIVDKMMPKGFSEGVRLTIGEEELKHWVKHLREEERVDLVVMLSHNGFPQEMKMIRNVEGVDICLSGHTHHRIREAVVVNRTIVIQSGCHGSFIGRIDINVESKKVKSFQHKLIDIHDGIQPDPVVDEIVQRALDPHREMLSERVGETKTDLHRNLVMEAPMDNLLLQALVDLTGAELAFSNGWRYGAPITRGPITVNDLWNIIPVNPPVSVCSIKGSEVKEMMELNLERTFAADPYDQMGGYVKRCLGLNLYFKVENPPGSRIMRLFINGKPVDNDKTYRACYVTRQGVRPGFGSNKEDLDIDAITALRSYLEKFSPIEAAFRNTIIPI